MMTNRNDMAGLAETLAVEGAAIESIVQAAQPKREGLFAWRVQVRKAKGDETVKGGGGIRTRIRWAESLDQAKAFAANEIRNDAGDGVAFELLDVSPATGADLEVLATYVALGPNVWGKGPTELEALAKAREANGGRALGKAIVVLVHDPEAYIDGMGSVVHYASRPSVEVARYDRGRRTATLATPIVPVSTEAELRREMGTAAYDQASELVRQNVTGTASLWDLVTAAGGYRPTIRRERKLEALAAAYDLAQGLRGDDRRAYRG